VDPTASDCSGSALRDGEVTGMGGAGKRNSVASNSVSGLEWSSYEAAHDDKPCFGMRRFEFDQDD